VLWSAGGATVAVLRCSTARDGLLAETGGDTSAQTSYGTWPRAERAREIKTPIGTLKQAAEGRCSEHLPSALIPNPEKEGGDLMAEATQFDPDRIQLALDHGEVVELDGGTLVLGGQESPSVVLRLAPWRARSLARVLEEWSTVSRVFHRAARPSLEELELSRALELAASALGDTEPITPSPRDHRVVTSRQRLDAVTVLAKREPRLSAVQRLALIDAAASWLSEPHGGEQLAYALLGAACTAELTTEQVYLALITPDG